MSEYWAVKHWDERSTMCVKSCKHWAILQVAFGMGAIDLPRFSGYAAVSQNFSNLNVQNTKLAYIFCSTIFAKNTHTRCWYVVDTWYMPIAPCCIVCQKPVGLMRQVSYGNRLSEFLLFSCEAINAHAISVDMSSWKGFFKWAKNYCFIALNLCFELTKM